jgi:hypothetical protein
MVRTSHEEETFTGDTVRKLMKFAQGRARLPDDSRIPGSAWNLLSPDVRVTFLADPSKALEGLPGADPTPTPSAPIPQQHGRQANAVTQDAVGGSRTAQH